MLAYVTGSVDEKLLRRNEYLVAENRILQAQIPGRLKLTDDERRTLANTSRRFLAARKPSKTLARPAGLGTIRGERDQAADGPHLGREEVCGGDRVPVGGEKRPPGHRALRHGAHPLGPEDGGDRGPGDAMAEILQRALDPTVAPRRVLPRHSDAQLADLAEHARSADASSCDRPFPRDELPAPPQDRVWRDQRGHLRQGAPAETMPGGREAAALEVGQPQTPPPTCSLRTRFSARKYAMTSSWWRFTQPDRATRRIRSRTLSIIGPVYLHGPPRHPTEHSAGFSDSTRLKGQRYIDDILHIPSCRSSLTV